MTNKNDINGSESPHFNLPDEEQKVVAWQEIEEGRFMPQRVRGSCQGRALG
ncbi:MAG: hypothetical protein ACR2NZ_17810 [Rubripirellula sp.]